MHGIQREKHTEVTEGLFSEFGHSGSFPDAFERPELCLGLERSESVPSIEHSEVHRGIPFFTLMLEREGFLFFVFAARGYKSLSLINRTKTPF